MNRVTYARPTISPHLWLAACPACGRPNVLPRPGGTRPCQSCGRLMDVRALRPAQEERQDA